MKINLFSILLVIRAMFAKFTANQGTCNVIFGVNLHALNQIHSTDGLIAFFPSVNIINTKMVLTQSDY